MPPGGGDVFLLYRRLLNTPSFTDNTQIGSGLNGSGPLLAQTVSCGCFGRIYRRLRASEWFPARYPLGARLGLQARLPILEGDRRRASDRDVAGRMTDGYDALIAEIKGERVARAVG